MTDSLIWFQGSGLMTTYSGNLEIMALTKDYLVVNKVDVNGDNLVILVENFIWLHLAAMKWQNSLIVLDIPDMFSHFSHLTPLMKIYTRNSLSLTFNVKNMR